LNYNGSTSRDICDILAEVVSAAVAMVTGVAMTTFICGPFAAVAVNTKSNITLIGSGVWVYGPNNFKTLKTSNFTNIIAPKGRAP